MPDFMVKWRHHLRMLLLWILTFNAYAVQIDGEVKDQSGQPVANAVVVAMPKQPVSLNTRGSKKIEVLDQRNREFIPHVLVVQSGTGVSFPNNDSVRHHVYSFSPAKRFEIKLYKGMPANPVLFDSPGIAVLGCNIHDWMVSYVYVTDSPYFSKTDDAGYWTMDVPLDSYSISVWHPDMDQAQTSITDQLTPSEQQVTHLNRSVAVKRNFYTGKPPGSMQYEGYKGDP